MLIKGNPLLVTCVAGATLQVFIASSALAHNPGIEANAYCNYTDGLYYIDYTSTSWCTGDPECENSRIDILLNDIKVGEGAYTSQSYSFSGGPIAAPEGTFAIMSAHAFADWGDLRPGGQTASVKVYYGNDPLCVPPTMNGRFTGGGHQIRVDQVRVTRGLTIHCDLLLSNNLEVNWTGNQFHMTEHLETVACTDSPEIDQFPPAAPLDTLIGKGSGRFNGQDGYTIEFTLVDAGEPGGSDQMQILIYETGNAGNVVLDVPLQVLSGGNLQAHYDQPHK